MEKEYLTGLLIKRNEEPREIKLRYTENYLTDALYEIFNHAVIESTTLEGELNNITILYADFGDTANTKHKCRENSKYKDIANKVYGSFIIVGDLIGEGYAELTTEQLNYWKEEFKL